MTHKPQDFSTENKLDVSTTLSNEIEAENHLLLQPERLIDNAPIGVSAQLSTNHTTITVTWNAPNGSISLAQSDITTGLVITLLGGTSPHFPPYDDTSIQKDHTYQYILTTLTNNVQYYSNLVTVPHFVNRPRA